jgi:hypothetical protein
MRRLPLAWPLSLLLVFAQHGAVLHEVGHLSHASQVSHAAGGSSLSDPGAEDDSPCNTCEAYAQVANPAGGGHAELPLYLAPPGSLSTPAHAILTTDAPTACSRGPPHI